MGSVCGDGRAVVVVDGVVGGAYQPRLERLVCHVVFVSLSISPARVHHGIGDSALGITHTGNDGA